MSKQHDLMCSIPKCGCPFARRQDGAIIIESRHHGERHVNILTADILEQWLAEMRPRKEVAPV